VTLCARIAPAHPSTHTNYRGTVPSHGNSRKIRKRPELWRANEGANSSTRCATLTPSASLCGPKRCWNRPVSTPFLAQTALESPPSGNSYLVQELSCSTPVHESDAWWRIAVLAEIRAGARKLEIKSETAGNSRDFARRGQPARGARSAVRGGFPGDCRVSASWSAGEKTLDCKNLFRDKA
jgi:hypothetical protein